MIHKSPSDACRILPTPYCLYKGCVICAMSENNPEMDSENSSMVPALITWEYLYSSPSEAYVSGASA